MGGKSQLAPIPACPHPTMAATPEITHTLARVLAQDDGTFVAAARWRYYVLHCGKHEGWRDGGGRDGDECWSTRWQVTMGGWGQISVGRWWGQVTVDRRGWQITMGRQRRVSVD
ncbi:hypothetical protein E2C01_009647 [Portunus trituberculatus]|uniref:Uncharacterized protein n=1 Tax=Portunus trituberculatus TaxID=210409 RepID=A0A5B7D6A8_PORTR|nr:hypothetical protein [Portunus trituberculatus]